MSDEVKLEPWPFFGYAPGNYTSRCYGCDRLVNDADKGVITCLDCAVIRAKALIINLKSSPTTAPPCPELVERVARAIAIPEHHTGWRHLSESDKDLYRMQAEYALREMTINPPKHRFWGAGESDCPREIKAGNGELHTLRCKVCEEDNPPNELCLGSAAIEVIRPTIVTGQDDVVKESPFAGTTFETRSERASREDDALIRELVEALTKIKQLKAQPIGSTGFATGPLSLLKQAQRIAEAATLKAKASQ